MSGCNDPAGAPARPATIEIIAGDGQHRAVGQEVRVPPAVRLRDVGEHDLEGIPVVFAARGRGALATPTVAITDRNGTARLTDWRLGLDPGEDSLFIRVEGFVPVSVVASAEQLESVALGGDHSCALLTSARAVCWGQGTSGELGRLLKRAVEPRNLVLGNHRFRQLVAGAGFSCGLGEAGEVWCWGMGNPTPAVVNAGMPLSLIRAARGFPVLCGIGTDSLAWCWGRVVPGAMPAALPVRMSDGSDRFTNLDINGESDAFGGTLRFATITADGRVGLGGFGGFSPVIVQPDNDWSVNQLPTPDRLSVGLTKTCGTKGTRAWCWGRGSLSDETFQTGAAEVKLGLPIAYLVVGPGLTCALTTAGRLFCWGLDLPVGERVMPNRVPIRDFDLSNGHACAITRDARAWCWGDNRFGQLGNGTQQSSSEPVEVLPGF